MRSTIRSAPVFWASCGDRSPDPASWLDWVSERTTDGNCDLLKTIGVYARAYHLKGSKYYHDRDLPNRVVASPAEAGVFARSPGQVEPRVAAGHDEPEEGERYRLVHRTVEVHGKQMPLEMVDADQPEVASLGDALRQRETDEQ